MPNVIRRYACHFMNQLRRVTSSTSPQSPPLSPDPSIEEQGHELSQDGETIEEYNRTHPIQLNTEVENSSMSSVSSSHTLERLPEVVDENDIIVELETAKSLRIDDALLESRKIQDTFEQKPKLVNTRHLMKELLHVRRASEESDGAFEIEPCTDEDDEVDFSEWEARFYKIDDTSTLWKSMQDFGVDCITFRISFPSDYPFSPPFVRLVSPYIDNGFVMNGGAICLEILTPQGWSSVYTLEALMVQVVASLAHGGAVVSKHHHKKQHKLTKKKAEAEFKRIVKIHNKYGWVKLERNEG